MCPHPVQGAGECCAWLGVEGACQELVGTTQIVDISSSNKAWPRGEGEGHSPSHIGSLTQFWSSEDWTYWDQ